MTFIQKQNGEMLDLDKLGIRTRDFIISSPSPDHSFESLENGLGQIDLGSSLGARDIAVLFRIEAQDHIDFGMFRDEIFNLLRGDQAFYLIERRNPGKRWKVKTKDPYTIPQNFVYGNFDVNFIAFTGVAESIGTTLNAYEWDVDLWQWGQGIPFGDVDYSYSNRSRFNIYNAGNITVDPRKVYQELLITLQALADSYIEIKNKTTNETYRYNGKMAANDTLRIDGIRSTKNSLSVFRNTNKKLISLVPGDNEIEILGASKVENVSFDFRFYYN